MLIAFNILEGFKKLDNKYESALQWISLQTQGMLKGIPKEHFQVLSHIYLYVFNFPHRIAYET